MPGAQSHSRGQTHCTDDRFALEPSAKACGEFSEDELAACRGSFPNGSAAAAPSKRGVDERHWLRKLLLEFFCEPRHGELSDVTCLLSWQRATSSSCPLPRGPRSACRRETSQSVTWGRFSLSRQTTGWQSPAECFSPSLSIFSPFTGVLWGSGKSLMEVWCEADERRRMHEAWKLWASIQNFTKGRAPCSSAN